VTDTALRLRQHSPASLADGGDADEGGEEAVFNFPLMAKHRDAFVAAVFEVAAARARFEQASPHVGPLARELLQGVPLERVIENTDFTSLPYQLGIFNHPF
jgi:hypothetical protein